MVIHCIRRPRKNGQIGFVWNLRIKMTLKHPANPLKEQKVDNDITTFRKFAPIISIFQEWLAEQNDYPQEGFIASINLTQSLIDENGHLLAGKVIQELKQSYREWNPKKVAN